MKHPALTRIFSVVLALLCLTMLIAGLGSARRAVRERTKSLADYERLQDRITEYRDIREQMEGKTSYRDADASLQEQQSDHDARASQHRIDLAVYTATRGGVQAGMEALLQAEATFAEGKAQYEEGLALFLEQEAAFWEGYEQFQEGKRQLEEGRQTLELAETAMQGLRSQLEQGRNLAAILDSDDEDARLELSVAAYDSLLASMDSAVLVYDTMKEQGGVSPEQMQLIAQMLAEQTGVDADELLEGITWEGISAESMQELEDQITESTGMTVEELREQIRKQRDSIAERDADTPITEEEFAILQAAYAEYRQQLEAVDSALEQKLEEYEEKIAEAQAEMDAAQEQIDAMEPILEQGRMAIEQARAAMDLAAAQMEAGELALADGRRQLEEQEAQLAEKEEQLRREKEELDAESESLSALSAQVQAMQELEQQETSVRLMLLERDGIRNRTEQGMDLLDAAEEYAAALLEQIGAAFTGRLWIVGCMVLGGLAGFFGIPAAFERIRSRFWLIGPVLLSLVLAVGAEILCRVQGRGDSYSALAAAVFALLQLALVIPGAKKEKTQTGGAI